MRLPLSPRRPWWRLDWHVVIPLAATLVVYFRVTGAYFFGDDFVHLNDVVNWPLRTVLWRPFMGHLYIIPTAHYWLLWHLFGPASEIFHSAVLLLHLVNVLLLFSLLRRLTDSPHLAAVVALLWGTCPLHAGSLSWFCVHGHVLVGSALLLAMNALASVAERGTPVDRRAVLWWACLLLASCTCFATGLALALVFPIVAALCIPRSMTRFAVAVLVTMPIVAGALYVALHHLYPPTAGYGPEVLMFLPMQAGRFAAMSLHLMAFSLASLCAGFWLYPLRYPSSVANVLAGGAATMIAIALIRSRSSRSWLLALLLAAAALYLAIAAGRVIVAMDMDVWVAQDRYHYAASIALAAAFGVALTTWQSIVSLPKGRLKAHLEARMKDGVVIGGTALALVSFARSGWTIGLHSEARAAVDAVLSEAAAAAHARPVGTPVYIPDR